MKYFGKWKAVSSSQGFWFLGQARRNPALCGVPLQQQGARGRALPPRVPAAEFLLPQPRRSRGPWKDLFCLRARSGSGEFQPGLGWVVLAQIFCSLTPEPEHKRFWKGPGSSLPRWLPGRAAELGQPRAVPNSSCSKSSPRVTERRCCIRHKTSQRCSSGSPGL